MSEPPPPGPQPTLAFFDGTHVMVVLDTTINDFSVLNPTNWTIRFAGFNHVAAFATAAPGDNVVDVSPGFDTDIAPGPPAISYTPPPYDITDETTGEPSLGWSTFPIT